MNKQTKMAHFHKAIYTQTPNTFWKLCKPFMSDKGPSKSNNIIKEDVLLLHDSDEVAECLNSYYNNVTKSLNLFKWNQSSNKVSSHPVRSAIEKFKEHLSIQKIKSIWGGGNTFKLREVSEKEIYDMIMELVCSKKLVDLSQIRF